MNTSLFDRGSAFRRRCSMLIMSAIAVLMFSPLLTTEVVAQDKEAQAAAKESISDLRKEFLREMKKMKEAYREAKSSERTKIIEERRKYEHDTVMQVIVAAEDLRSDQQKLKAYTFYVSQKVKGKALDALVKEVDKNLVESKYVADFVTELAATGKPGDNIVDLARKVVANAESDKAKGQSKMALVEVLSRLESGDSKDISEEIDSILADCLENYSDVKVGRAKIGALAKTKLSGRRFEVGKVAPDIVGVDLDDVEFKLSDYRGKVVVLDFWGDW